MNFATTILTIFAGLLVWILCGFVGFLIEAKQEKYKKFDSEAEEEFWASIALGAIALVFMVISTICSNIKKMFVMIYNSVKTLYLKNTRIHILNFMNSLLQKMNHEEGI